MIEKILGTGIALIDYSLARKKVIDWAFARESRYVCVANVHMVMEAYDSQEFRKIMNSADLVVSDGMPLVWMLRLKGKKDQKRVYGPALMLQVLEAAANEGVPVGFYGSSNEVLEKLVINMKGKYPGLKVVYSFSPPYREVSVSEDQSICNEIQNTGVRILFVGLGCPKQEIWMADHKEKMNTVMIGVGAAFDFHAGFKPQAPAWMQSLGLEWLFRLIHEPRRLAKRYLYNNPRFVVLALLDLVGILNRGKKEG
jgi:N-acetylglucosaminyldiphosphoundecaprenol N-acetyl-beta-D-mannosaminyltransferase